MALSSGKKMTQDFVGQLFRITAFSLNFKVGQLTIDGLADGQQMLDFRQRIFVRQAWSA